MIPLDSIKLFKIEEIKHHVGLLKNVFKYYNQENPTVNFILNLEIDKVRDIRGTGQGTIYKIELLKKILNENKDNFLSKYIEDETGSHQIEDIRKRFGNNALYIKLKELKITEIEKKCLSKIEKLLAIKSLNYNIYNNWKSVTLPEDIKKINIQDFIKLSRSNVEEHKKIGQGTSKQVNSLRAKLDTYIEEHQSSRIFINANTSSSVVERVLIEDLDNFIENLDPRNKVIFQKRLGYKISLKTLEEISQQYSITRERIRQLEKNIYENFLSFRRLNKNELIDYLKNIENKGFHSIFQNLEKLFFDKDDDNSLVRIKSQSIVEDNLIFFLEKYCEVEKGFFLTPEIAAYNILENINKITISFPELDFPLSQEDISEELMQEFGYQKEITENCLKYIIENKILTLDSNGRYYPLKLIYNKEVLIVLNNYPEGLHWTEIKLKISNSPSNNINKVVRGTGQLEHGIEDKVMFCGKGSLRLTKFRNLSDYNNDALFNKIINYFESSKSHFTHLNILFESIKKDSSNEMDIYDLRYLIKNYGKEYGLYFSGKSQASTVSMGKKIRLNISDNIVHLLEQYEHPLEMNKIIQSLKGNETLYRDRANQLVEDGKICRYDISSFINNESAYRDLDIDKVGSLITKILDSKNFTTINFLSSQLNQILMTNKSKYFYSSFAKYFIKLNNLKYSHYSDYFSKVEIKHSRFSQLLLEMCDSNKSIDGNFEEISKTINLTKSYFRIFFQNHYLYNQ